MIVRLSLLILIVLVGSVANGTSAERVDVVVGSKAPQLEQFAARQLASQFERLFNAKTELANAAPKKSSHLVLIGSPSTNPSIKQVVADKWPKLSDQGLVLRSFDSKGRRGVIVGGESPVATLWAVYELGHRFGIRYLLRDDIYPEAKIPLKLDGMDVMMEPELRTRTWRTINDFAIGPESWPLADHNRLLGQLAKMKFNRVMLSVYPWQPFVDYKFRGVKKQTAMLWYGEKYDLSGDTPGRAALGGARQFENPDFAGKTTYDEMTTAGIAHARGIIDEAHRLGMSVGISISPLEFPREFAKVLPGAKASRGLNNLVVAPGAKQRHDDPLLKELVTTKVRAYLATYPVDVLYFTLPEFPEWDEHAEAAWQDLQKRLGSKKLSLDKLIQDAAKRDLIASGERGKRALKGNVVALSFLNHLLEDSGLLERPDGKRVELVITSVDPALFGVLEHVLPKDAATLNFIDYTARRVAKNLKVLDTVPADKVRSQLIMTLADDNVGVLSQSATQRIETLVGQIRSRGWDGFSTRYWMLTELDPTVYNLSRASWDPKATARSTHDDLFNAITGKQSVSDRMWLAFENIEKATELTDQHDLGFGFPVKGMLMKHYQPDPVPDWWKPLVEHYTQAMIELYRSHDAADPRSRKLLFYYAKRSEYVLQYLGAVQAVREAAIARKKGDNEKAIEQLEAAIESLYNAIDTLGDVPRDQSDRGLIAVLNAYAYRPLVAEYERMLKETEK